MRRFFVTLICFFGIFALATPAAADSTKTITAVSSARCGGDQFEVAAVFVITKIYDAPVITVFMEDGSGDFAATSIDGDTASYNVSLSSPIDRSNMAAATVLADWNGSFELKTVTCQDLAEPSVTINASQCSNGAANITVTIKNNSSVSLNFTIEVENFSTQTANIAAGSGKTFSFGPATNGLYGVIVSWANDSAQDNILVNCNSSASPTPSASRSSESASASASASVSASISAEAKSPSIRASTHATATKTTGASSGKEHQFFNSFTIALTFIGFLLIGIGVYILWYLHKKRG